MRDSTGFITSGVEFCCSGCVIAESSYCFLFFDFLAILKSNN